MPSWFRFVNDLTCQLGNTRTLQPFIRRQRLLQVVLRRLHRNLHFKCRTTRLGPGSSKLCLSNDDVNNNIYIISSGSGLV